ncbi:30S ribosomal protein S3 [Candidatus Gugararchaeum adminiculabundum]|nr:30S ribosomal protein S3 [Candidatus Gugararchaeum adminiculabundum]
MVVERKFIEDAIARYNVSKFLEGELDRAGFSKVDIQRTPMVTRISVSVTTPGRVIGRKGKSIRDLTEAIEKEFDISNPQISVASVSEPSLDPRLMAKKAVKGIEMGKNLRRILQFLLKEIMDAGALGAEIVASGKIVAKGGRAKTKRVFAGYIPKAGEPARLVHEAHVTAYPKSGAIGVLVRIVMPGTEFPDKKILKPLALPRVIAAATEDEINSSREETEAADAEKKKLAAAAQDARRRMPAQKRSAPRRHPQKRR